MNNLERKKKYKLKGKIFVVISCVICLVIGVGIGSIIPRKQKSNNTNKDNILLINEIMDIINTSWLDPNDDEKDKNLSQQMFKGLVSSLNDPYTSYMTMDEAEDYYQSIDGDVVGIGVTFLGIEEGGLITDVFTGAPAKNAGIKSGDIIVKIDGVSVAGKTATDIRKLVTGESGSEVNITVLRDKKNLDFKIIRKDVETDVDYRIKNNYGYIKLTTFGSNTAEHVESVFKELKAQNIDNLVFDLRGNGGGYTKAVEGILSLLVPDNQVIYKLQFKNDTEVIKSSGKNKYDFKNGFVLMDNNSASCSEILIGGLTEILGYKTIGTQSFGKGIAQSRATLSDGNDLKYTFAKWLTPSGICIHGKGFTPDYKVKEDDISDYVYEKFEKTYKYNSVSTNVIYMQRMLKRLGYKVDRVDGYFSKATESALKQFQHSIGLKEDGVYTYSLAKKLYSSTVVKVLQSGKDKGLDKVEELLK